MSIYATTPRRSSRARNPHKGHRHLNNFARQIVIAEFGWHFARALDQADFIDRSPGELPGPSPEARQ